MVKLNTYADGEKMIAGLLNKIVSQNLHALLKGILEFNPDQRFELNYSKSFSRECLRKWFKNK